MFLADPEDAGKAGPFGLLAIIILGVACYFLFKSMSRHLKKVRETYPDADADIRLADQQPPVESSTDAQGDPAGPIHPTTIPPPG